MSLSLGTSVPRHNDGSRGHALCLPVIANWAGVGHLVLNGAVILNGSTRLGIGFRERDLFSADYFKRRVCKFRVTGQPHLATFDFGSLSQQEPVWEVGWSRHVESEMKGHLASGKQRRRGRVGGREREKEKQEGWGREAAGCGEKGTPTGVSYFFPTSGSKSLLGSLAVLCNLEIQAMPLYHFPLMKTRLCSLTSPVVE